MSEVEKLFRDFLKKLNAGSKGLIIYTGNPDFNGQYLSKKLWGKLLGKSTKSLPNLATKEQELKLKVDFYEGIASAGLPEIKKYFTNKQIRKNNAKQDRKKKPTKQELLAFMSEYEAKNAKTHGSKKQASKQFEISVDTIRKILKQE